MATTTSGIDWKSAPEDYAALYRIYFPYMVNLVAKNGIDANNKEDVASDIFLRLMEHKFIEDFNPDLVFEYKGQPRPARFKSFLARTVTLYTRGYYDKQRRLARREVQICDLQTGEETSNAFSYGEHDGTSWADLYGEATHDHADEVIELVVFEQDARGIRDWLAGRPKRSVHDTCDLVALYDAIRLQILHYGEYNVAVLETKFHISTTTMYNWIHWLKKNLAVAYGRETPAKRRRVLHNKAGQ